MTGVRRTGTRQRLNCGKMDKKGGNSERDIRDEKKGLARLT